MAQQVLQRLVDDIDGSEGTQTVEFSLDGKDLMIDLNDEHAAQLRDALAPYLAAARRAGGAGGGAVQRRQSAAPKRGRQDLAEVRRWLAAHGYPVKERGRIPDAWVTDYDAKSPNPPEPALEEAVSEVEQPKRSSGVVAPVFQAVS